MVKHQGKFPIQHGLKQFLTNDEHGSKIIISEKKIGKLE